MNLGGFGPIDSVSRIGNSKPELTKVSASADSSPSVLSTKASVSDAKNFRKALAKASEQGRESSNESSIERKVSESNENLAGATSAVQTSSTVPQERSSQVGARRENPRERVPTQIVPGTDLDSGPTKIDASVPAEATGEAAVEQPEGLTSSKPIDERIGAIVESLEQTAETELSMRHLSMRDFLGKMNSEFGIEPQAVVKAFAGLDAAALMAPPDETADAVLSQLKLTPEQLPKAERFYREMLNQTGESALSETLVGVSAGVSLKVMSEQDVAMTKLQSSISNLNDVFARRTDANAGVQSDAAVNAINEVVNANPMKIAIDASVKSATDTTAIEPAANPVESPATEKESSGSKFAAIGAALSSAAMNLNETSMAGNSGQGSESSGSSSQDSANEPRTEYSSIESALAASGFEIPPSVDKASVPLTAGTSTAAALASAMLPNAEAESSGNAQELVRHAQILMKNGGGEMKMQLKPEGIGEVTLKVAVKDGQVAIQMLTENDSAKKLLEGNLDDLKTSLAQNKLHVDAMKIEVGTEFAKQRFEQSQQDASREQARQMAQDFMGQFRQDREGFRQGFGESLGFKNYQQPRRNSLPEIEPVVAASGSQQKSGERRLNLVA